MMKKSVLSGIGLAMAMMLTACGSTDGGAAAEAPAATEEPAEEAAAGTEEASEETEEAAAAEGDAVADVNGDGKITAAFIAKCATDPFQTLLNDTVTEQMESLIAEGVIDEWSGVLDPNTDPSQQCDYAQNCITGGYDFVVISPAEVSASDPAVTSMVEAGIHVIVLNTKTDNSDRALTFVGSDDTFAGEMMANFVLEQVPEGGSYLHCQGVIGNSAQVLRGQGVENVMGTAQEWTLAGEEPCEWQGDKASNAAANYIVMKGDDLKAIICDNDDMATAAQEYCNSVGREDIVCIGVDGTDNAKSMIKAGTLRASVLQDGAGQASQAVQVIKAMVNGEEIQNEYYIDFVTLTAENVDDYM